MTMIKSATLDLQIYCDSQVPGDTGTTGRHGHTDMVPGHLQIRHLELATPGLDESSLFVIVQIPGKEMV